MYFIIDDISNFLDFFSIFQIFSNCCKSWKKNLPIYLLKRNPQYKWTCTVQICLFKVWPNASSYARHTVRPNWNTGVWNRERFIARTKEGEWVAVLIRCELWWFSGKCFYRQNLGWGLQGVWLLIGWWWVSMVVFQESCAQPEVTVVHPGGGLNSYRKTQRYCNVYPLRGNQDPAPWLSYCFLTAFPWFLHSFTLLISNHLNLPFET